MTRNLTKDELHKLLDSFQEQVNILQEERSLFLSERLSNEKLRILLEKRVQTYQAIINSKDSDEGPALKRKRSVDPTEFPITLEPQTSKNCGGIQYLVSLFSAKPDKKELRVFQSGIIRFVTKPDLLGVLGLSQCRFPYLNVAKIDRTMFTLWAKDNSYNYGARLAYFYVVDQTLIDYLAKFSDSLGIAKELKRQL